MPTITQISQAITNSERVNIYLDGRFWLGLHKNLLLSFKLTKGRELTEEEKQEIEKVAFDQKQVEAALRYLHIRPRSCGEVRDYLKFTRKLSEDEAENVIAHLQEKELLSDEKFARWYIDYKLSSGVNGINKIKIGLLQKKVSKEVIANVLIDATTSDDFTNDQTVKINEYVQKITSSIKAKNIFEFKAKLTQKLLAKGFPYNAIKEVVQKVSQGT